MLLLLLCALSCASLTLVVPCVLDAAFLSDVSAPMNLAGDPAKINEWRGAAIFFTDKFETSLFVKVLQCTLAMATTFVWFSVLHYASRTSESVQTSTCILFF